MKEPHKVVLIAVGLSLVLWFSVNQFMNSTHNFAQALDVRGVAYVEREKVAEAPEPVQQVRELSRTERRERDETAERVREQQAQLLRASAAPKAPEAPDHADGPAAMTVSSPDVALADEDTAVAEQQDEGVEPSRADSDSDIRAVAAAEEAAEDETNAEGATSSRQVDGQRPVDAESRSADTRDDRSATGGNGADDASDEEREAPVRPSITVPTRNRAAELDILQHLNEELVSGKPLTRAVDVRLSTQARAGCAAAIDAPPRVGVFFRHSSPAIRGESLNQIDQLIRVWRACGEGELVIDRNPQGSIDSNEFLSARREDEVKYYLLQRSVPKDLIVYGGRR